jgi:hypothetical protein
MIKSAKAFSALILMGLLLFGCLPVSSNINETPAVIAAIPVDTAILTKTATSTSPAKPTGIQIPTEIQSTLPAADSTPVPEILVLQNDLPGKYLPTVIDCRPEDGYYIEENGYSPVPNQEVMNDMGMDLGRKYIVETGRVTGWKVEYINLINKLKPRRVVAEAVMHERPEGAQKALLHYNPISLYPESGWQDMASEFQGYEKQKAYIRKDHTGTASEFWQVQIEFTYYNYFMKILAEGTPTQMDMSFLQYLVKVSNIRLEEEYLYALQPEPTPTLPFSEELPTTVKPQNLVLSQNDLPKEAGYRSSKYDDKAFQNIQIIRQWGVDLGRKYVISTDRKFGWDISYNSYERRYWVDQVNKAFDQWCDENFEKWLNDDPHYEPFTVPIIYRTKKYPDFIDCQAIQYGSAEGARKALSITEEKSYPSQNGWKIIQGYETVGEASVIKINHSVGGNGDIY